MDGPYVEGSKQRVYFGLDQVFLPVEAFTGIVFAISKRVWS